MLGVFVVLCQVDGYPVPVCHVIPSCYLSVQLIDRLENFAWKIGSPCIVVYGWDEITVEYSLSGSFWHMLRTEMENAEIDKHQWNCESNTSFNAASFNSSHCHLGRFKPLSCHVSPLSAFSIFCNICEAGDVVTNVWKLCTSCLDNTL